MAETEPLDQQEVAQMQELRAGAYEMLAALLSDVPPEGIVDSLASLPPISPDQGSMAEGWEALRLAAKNHDRQRLTDEYHALFVGLDKGEVTPFACWYLTGSLMSRPLSKLREDLASLGITRQEGVRETEDHIAALCAAMAILIRSEADIAAQRQQQFYEAHLANWCGKFYTDLQSAGHADFYKAVGLFGKRFDELEQHWYSLN